MKNFNETKKHILSYTLPALMFGALSGAVSAAVVTIYKWFAKNSVAISEKAYHFLGQNYVYIPIAIVVLLVAAIISARIYRSTPNLQGGGIPTSIGAMRGYYSLHPLKNTIGVFFLSLASFIIGIPLGTEGPSVQMGAAVGSGLVKSSRKKWLAWDRFSMTGGASAGFSVATGAPISAILFSIEEAHQRVSPLIVFIAIVSVLSASIVSNILSPILGVEKSLFSLSDFGELSLDKLWIPLVVGLFMGIFALIFLKGYKIIKRIYEKLADRFSQTVRIFAVMLFTLTFGLISFSFVSTGHHFTVSLFASSPTVLMLLAIIILRSTLTLSANLNGITGGIFLPLLAIGAAAAALLGKGLVAIGMASEYTTLILALGICGAIAGMMKMPLTAILFAIEALGLSDNILAVIITAAIAFSIPEMIGENSIGEHVLENRIKKLSSGKEIKRGEMEVTIENGCFAIGKEVRDIFWPHGVYVTSIQHIKNGQLIDDGDRLIINYNTSDFEKMEKELFAITKKL